ncbi:hypothetical protein ACRRTK_013986 [Alexandromys fortis]
MSQIIMMIMEQIIVSPTITFSYVNFLLLLKSATLMIFTSKVIAHCFGGISQYDPGFMYFRVIT